MPGRGDGQIPEDRAFCDLCGLTVCQLVVSFQQLFLIIHSSGNRRRCGKQLLHSEEIRVGIHRNARLTLLNREQLAQWAAAQGLTHEVSCIKKLGGMGERTL